MSETSSQTPSQTLARTLETEVMDTEEEARDYDAMDHREVNARFCADLLAFRLNSLSFPGHLDFSLTQRHEERPDVGLHSTAWREPSPTPAYAR